MAATQELILDGQSFSPEEMEQYLKGTETTSRSLTAHPFVESLKREWPQILLATSVVIGVNHSSEILNLIDQLLRMVK